MRTTLTIDDDVAAWLKRKRKERGASLKDLVNETLRRGIHATDAPPKPRKKFETRVFDAGEPLFPVDSIDRALAYGEGENYK